ncbi:MAG: hypothetical protein JW881_03955 [Spirochaetales bacterium]|nr:hypothetical protein [Spirochaetales bacterium]
MSRKELKEIIASVIERLQNCAPAPACGVLWADETVATTKYAIGEEDPNPTKPPEPTPTPVATTKYSIGEEDTVTTLYSVGEEG